MAPPTNTQFSLATHLLTLLAETPDKLLDSTELACGPATNPAHARRVLGHLRRADIVVSRPGASGGWSLARPARKIDLAQVYLAVNGDEPILGIHLSSPNCQVGAMVARQLQAIDHDTRLALLAELSRTTIADLLEDAHLAVAAATAADNSQCASISAPSRTTA